QAHLNGHPYAANEMGYCLLIGDCGAPQDYPSAARWFRLGVEQGDTDAAYNLGRMLAYGQGEERDDAEATRLLAIAANDGNDAAAFNVAFRFGEGLDAAPNYRAQRKYFEQIEASGFGPADYLQTDAFFQAFEGGETIAAILDKADVRPREMPAALMRIIAAIESSYDPGSDVVVVHFEEDATYAYDAEYAPYMVFALVRMAASLGSTQAQLRMASYYEEGNLVPRSLVEAHYWRERAAQ
ncbi:MAG: hypothetical protein R3358_06685, partial [Woeseiaceae bacterium]|nr:hypothetical protein [Woeseiaceae bacterium]